MITACARAAELQALVVHKLLMRLVSSVVTVDAAGILCSPLPSTLAARALVMVAVLPGYVDALNVTPGSTTAA